MLLNIYPFTPNFNNHDVNFIENLWTYFNTFHIKIIYLYPEVFQVKHFFSKNKGNINTV